MTQRTIQDRPQYPGHIQEGRYKMNEVMRIIADNHIKIFSIVASLLNAFLIILTVYVIVAS